MYNRLYTAIYKVTANNKVQQVVDYNLKNKTYVLQHNNLLHFSADEAFDGTYHTNVIVTSEGMWCVHMYTEVSHHDLPDKLTNRYVHLHPPRHLQVHLQDRHHLVPLWRPGLRHEVWQLDVWRIQGESWSSSVCVMISIVFIVINMFKVELKLKAEAGDLGSYTNNAEWDLLSEP